MNKKYVNENTQQITLYITKKQHKAMKIIAVNENFSFSEYLRSLIKEDFKKRGIENE